MVKIISVCMRCQKYKNPKNEWQESPPHIHQEDEMDLSHTYCPACAPIVRKEMFGE